MDSFEKAIQDQVKQDAEEWKKEHFELKPGEKYFQLIAEGVSLKDSINRLVYEITNDPDYFYLWQSNIAGAFYDMAAKYSIKNGIYWNLEDARITMEIANNAAVNFLNNLCNQPKILGKKKPNE